MFIASSPHPQLESVDGFTSLQWNTLPACRASACRRSPASFPKPRLQRITLCNKDGIFQVCLQRVTIINLVPQEHEEAEQKDTKQHDCTKEQDSSFTTSFLLSFKLSFGCAKRIQIGVAPAVKLIKQIWTQSTGLMILWSILVIFK